MESTVLRAEKVLWRTNHVEHPLQQCDAPARKLEGFMSSQSYKKPNHLIIATQTGNFDAFKK